jgi:hypothetical protein
MSGCNLLEQAATCSAATCSNSWQHVLLQHARTGCNFMLHFVTANRFYGFDVILVALPTKLKMFKRCSRQRITIFSAVTNNYAISPNKSENIRPQT